MWPRGKVLGGSSSINGLLYVRGQREDYDVWRQLGCDGWGWDDVAPYFEGSVDVVEERRKRRGGAIRVSHIHPNYATSQAVIDSCVALGLPNRDFNGAEQEGVNWYPSAIERGRRQSAAVGYLHAAMKRPTLDVVTDSIVTRIVFDGRRAIGVEVLRGGVRRILRATREVILTAGAVGSPQLLQLSGVGSAAALQDLGIAVTADLPGVGGNLQDHYVVPTTFRLHPGVPSINHVTRGWRLAAEALRYVWRRDGLFAMSAAHVGVFCRSSPEAEQPDVQFHIAPATVDLESMKLQKMEMEREPGITIAPCLLRPLSRGRIDIVSPDVLAHPRIVPNYLSHPTDQRVIVDGIRWARRIAGQSPLSDLIAHEIMPGSTLDSDAELLRFAQEVGTTIYHPVETCAMGRGGGTVVDARLRVHGLEGLRVVDASLMSRLLSGNTNAATIMIAEKATDMILAVVHETRSPGAA